MPYHSHIFRLAEGHNEAALLDELRTMTEPMAGKFTWDPETHELVGTYPAKWEKVIQSLVSDLTRKHVAEVPDPQINSNALAKLIELEAESVELQQRVGSRHPELIRVQKQLDAYRKHLIPTKAFLD